MDRYPHLFAAEQDCDLYGWLEQVGCYSPIVHLQQSNGKSSSHLPFTAACNETGIVHPLKVLQAIARSYTKEPRPGMPRRCAEVYLAPGTNILDIGVLIEGDAVPDNVVNILDFSLLRVLYGSADPHADLNQDGVVDILDFSLLSENFGQMGDWP